ncbi:MAG: hypothetical protein AAF645_04605 [Myxococcota bacterium]
MTLRSYYADQNFFGANIGTRMSAMKLAGGTLLYSPIAKTDALRDELSDVRWVLAPSKFHHLSAGEWFGEGVRSYAPQGLHEKRQDLSFDEVIAEPGEPFGDEVYVFPLRFIPMTSEVVILHRESRSLIVCDLVFNITKENTFGARFMMGLVGGYPGVRPSLLEKLATKKDLAREDVGALLDLDFDRLVLAHGAIVESGGKDALAKAYSWLGV